MQTIGTKAVHPAISEITSRASRVEVGLWQERALKKALKRGPADHLRRVTSLSGLKNAMKADDVPRPASRRIIKAFEGGEVFLVPDKRGVARLLRKAMEVLDWFDSMPDDDRHLKRIDRISWGEAVAASDLWHGRLAGRRAMEIEIAAGDVRTLHEFEDGGRVVDLLTANALKDEGARMAHCVGGYWAVVKRGEARILSVRDTHNAPHVTIELRRPPSIMVHGHGRLFVDRKPENGVQRVSGIKGNWQAVQIRGKQNAPPVVKWGRKVREFLSAAGLDVRDVDFRYSIKGNAPLTVYAVNGSYYSNPDAAADQGEAVVLKTVARGGKFPLSYKASGLAAVHGCVSDGARVVKFLNDGGPLETREAPLISIMNKSLTAMHHRVPLRPLLALVIGNRDDVFADVVARIAPGLEELVSVMESNPGNLHVIKDKDGTFGDKEIKSALLMCGLGQRFAEAIAKNEKALRLTVSDVRLTVKRARRAGTECAESINRATNLLSDGFETRIQRLIRERGVICAFERDTSKDSSLISGLKY
ncbi:PcfJ domain-containing protein [Roseibium sp. RKSG952]|uniref:PcfJ domain-containing protein n=1 Tax=Roseibium sp. RKSG952 TaxID=2529384 RepID=UPI0012BD6359|nr:PcfJ domain-containing protein [Roseibium sp. RKSG952]MTH94860.1 hypothetical protein [Roseibium sp. RKSG952]